VLQPRQNENSAKLQAQLGFLLTDFDLKNFFLLVFSSGLIVLKINWKLSINKVKLRVTKPLLKTVKEQSNRYSISCGNPVWISFCTYFKQ